jgi:hypothetical protein
MKRHRERLRKRDTTRKRHQVRERVAIPPAKYPAGTRVTYDFGKVWGIPRAKSRVAGVVTGVKGCFLGTPELGTWIYVVSLDEPFCGVQEGWHFAESKIKLERPGEL